MPEGRNLEYKRDLWAEAGKGHREYIRDLGAFANAGAGDLVLGLAERDGVAAELIGLDVADPQRLQTALENRHRNRIEPRIAGIRMRWIVLAIGRQTLVIRVPAACRVCIATGRTVIFSFVARPGRTRWASTSCAMLSSAPTS